MQFILIPEPPVVSTHQYGELITSPKSPFSKFITLLSVIVLIWPLPHLIAQLVLLYASVLRLMGTPANLTNVMARASTIEPSLYSITLDFPSKCQSIDILSYEHVIEMRAYDDERITWILCQRVGTLTSERQFEEVSFPMGLHILK